MVNPPPQSMKSPIWPAATLGLFVTSAMPLLLGIHHPSGLSSQSLRLCSEGEMAAEPAERQFEQLPRRPAGLHLCSGTGPSSQPRLSMHQEAPWTYLFTPFADMQFA